MYPVVKIYVTPEPDGKLAPVFVTVGEGDNARSLPVLDAALEASPNGSKHGTRALTATLTFQIGAGSGIETIEDPETLARIQAGAPPLGADIVRALP